MKTQNKSTTAFGAIHTANARLLLPQSAETFRIYKTTHADKAFMQHLQETVKLNELRAVTTTLSEIFGFAAGPLPDMTMDGYGKANLHIKNKNTDIKKAAQLNGKVEILSATNVRHKDLALPVDTATGEVLFKGTQIEYDLNGVMKLSPLKVTGYSSIPDATSNLTLTTKSTPLDSGLYLINNSPLLSKAKENLKLIKQANGTADLTIFLTGKNETEFTA